MPRITATKPPTKSRPKSAKPAAIPIDNPVDPEAERSAVKASNYAVGELVSHPMFGDGTVMAVDANKFTIKFKDGRVKQIVDYYVKRRPR